VKLSVETDEGPSPSIRLPRVPKYRVLQGSVQVPMAGSNGALFLGNNTILQPTAHCSGLPRQACPLLERVYPDWRIQTSACNSVSN